ncbi:MAG: hypothetical protein JO175_06890, partial [Candidatus Eremiobacteraeota bacterium]|nr:hypothetical protein [Candidatus Eremiobacteraeota bacterium]
RTARLDPARTGLGRIYFCEHLTPELVWRNEWLRHRNGAQTIIRLLVAADEVPRLAALFSGLFGTSAVRWDWDGMSMQAGNARIDVRSHAAVAGELGDAAPEPAGRPDYMAAITFRVGALDRTARVLTSTIDRARADGNLIVPANACGNVALIFTE